MDTYGGCCGSCIHLNVNDYVRTKDNCKCTLRGGYHNLHERACPRPMYEYDENRDYYDLNHRWYIVTAIFTVLGLNDNYECINLLHNFRNNILSKDSKYDNVLAEYDIVGPVLAKNLIEDEDSIELCKKLSQVYLIRVLDLIKEEKYDDALNLYTEMINLLKVIYNVNLTEEESKTKNR